VLAPFVAKYKLIENRHMTHVVNRWDVEGARLGSIQNAWFNGAGYQTVSAAVEATIVHRV
jgi:hypothetical protein